GLNEGKVLIEELLSFAAVGEQDDLVGNVSRVGFTQHLLRILFSSLAGNDDLLRLVEVIIESRQHLRRRLRKLIQPPAKQRQRPVGHLTPLAIVSHLGQPQQIQRRDGIARRLRSVVILFGSEEQRRILSRGVEEASLLAII